MHAIYQSDPDFGSLASVILRINRNGEEITDTLECADGTYAIVTKNAARECRPSLSYPIETRVEKPDLHGGASRVIDEEVIAERSARWDDPA